MILYLIPYAILGLIGGYIAAHKGYPPLWGILAGIFLGPIALAVAACLPATAAAKERAREEAATAQELAYSRQTRPCPGCGRQNSVICPVCPQCELRL